MNQLKNEVNPKQELVRQYWRAEQHRKTHLLALKDHFDTISKKPVVNEQNQKTINLAENATTQMKKSGMRENRQQGQNQMSLSNYANLTIGEGR